MNIIKKLTNFILRRKEEQVGLLNEGTINNDINYNEFGNRLIVPTNAVKEPSIEDCICEFIRQYSIFQKNSSNKVDPYKVFISMFCKEEEIGENKKNQEKLSKYVKKLGYSIGYQSSEKRVSFMHITGKTGVDTHNNPSLHKLYINCDRKNTARLTAEVFKSIKDIVGDKLQMKCISEQLLAEQEEYEKEQTIKNYQRNDKIVIYAENSSVAEKIAEEINVIRSKKPELFNNEKVTPLLKKLHGFIGVAQEKKYAYAVTPLGHASGITYNEYLSNILFQSIVSGFDEELFVNPNYTKESPEERMQQYASIFPEFSDNLRMSVLKKCKDIFTDVCEKYNVETVYNKNIGKDKNHDEKELI